MKAFLFALILGCAGNLFSQQTYSWINYPCYENLNQFEERIRSFRLLMGDVKELTDTMYNYYSEVPRLKRVAKYDPSGNIVSFEQIWLDSTGVDPSWYEFVSFHYNDSNQLISETFSKIQGGDTIAMNMVRVPQWFGPTKKKLRTTKSFQNSHDSTYEAEPVYVFHDVHGRKVKDSLPRAYGEGFVNRYTYLEDSIVYEEQWTADLRSVSHREEFSLDEHGNWTQRRIFGLFDVHKKDRWETLCRRSIVYFEED